MTTSKEKRGRTNTKRDAFKGEMITIKLSSIKHVKYQVRKLRIWC